MARRTHSETTRHGVTALLVAAVLAAAFNASGPLWSPWPDPPSPLFVLRIAGGLSFIVGGLIAARRPSGRRIGTLLLAAGLVYFIPSIGLARSSFTFTVSDVTSWLYLAVGAHLVLAFPEGRLRSRFERGLVAFIYLWMIASNVLVDTTWNPRERGCADCPDNLLLLYDDGGLNDLLARSTSVVGVANALLVLAVLARHWRRAGRPERRIFAPVFWAFAANVGLAVARENALVLDLSNRAFEVILYLEALALIAVTVALLVGYLRSALARAAVGDLVVRVSRSVTPAQLDSDIASALGDPSAWVARWSPEREAFVDADGAPVALPDARTAGRSVVPIAGLEGQLAALICDASLTRDQPELVDAVAAAARLALENQRLQDEVRLSREVPAGLAERLQRGGRRIGETETLTVTVLMSDVRGYSTLAEHADPHALARQLNEHRTAMNRVIADRGGTVMQFVGDAVFAVFGAPQPLDDSAQAAVHAATAMQRAQARINDEWSRAGLPCFELGIGLTTGDVAAALLGSEEHVEYSIVGDVVNLAQRLQQWAEPGDVVIDEATFAGVDGVDAEALPPSRVKGRRTPVASYRLRPAPGTRALVAGATS